jgi:hypothetical protein
MSRDVEFNEGRRGSGPNKPVLQTWTSSLSWKMQTVLIQGLRAPDSHYCPEVKKVSRWLRSKVLNNADSKHTFMKSSAELPDNKTLEDELGYCTLHYVSHLLYDLEIVGYYHPDAETRSAALDLYMDLVTDTLHLNVESKKQCEERLADVDEKPASSKPPKSKPVELPKASSESKYWR